MKRAGISLALMVMLLLGAAAPVQAQAEETGLAAEAESFYRSVLAAKDRETLQTYLDCFSDQRRVELRAELFHGGKAGDELRREHIRVQTGSTSSGTASRSTGTATRLGRGCHRFP